jgi:MFS family permease
LIHQIRRYIHEYPRTFWMLIFSVFIDHMGAAMLYPFLALYVTSHFKVGMTQAGQLFAIFSVSAIIGSMIGGAMADKFGRKKVILFGMVASASSSLLMGFVDDIRWFYLIAAFMGVLANCGSPAQNAMVGDLLPQEKQASGFGMIRVAFNISFAFGPLIGGYLAGINFLYIFLFDAFISYVTAVFFLIFIPETRPAQTKHQASLSLLMTFRGYGEVLRNHLFLLLIAALVLIQIVYEQLNTTLPVFLRDVHGVQTSQFGILLSINAAMVVLLQLWVTNRTVKFPPMLVMAFSGFLYLIGFGLFGFAASFPWFVVCMVIITIGEMTMSPVVLASVSRFAGEENRARYMAVFEFGWMLPNTFASILGGIVLDNLNPHWLWYGCAGIGLIVVLVYLLLHWFGGNKLRIPDARYQEYLQQAGK